MDRGERGFPRGASDRPGSGREGILLRRGIAEDLEEILEMTLEMARESEGKELDPATARRGVSALLEDPAKGFYLVAQAEGGLAGQLFVTFEWSDWRAGWIWWIQTVYTRPSYRERGVFRALQEEVARLARLAGDVRGLRLYVAGGNRNALAAYERTGWRRADYVLYEKMWEEG